MSSQLESKGLTREHIVTFECITCGDGKLFETPAAFREHMQSVHQLKEHIGSKKMMLHLDTATHFISTYECEIGGVKFFRTTNTERETAFRMRRNKASQKQLNAIEPPQP